MWRKEWKQGVESKRRCRMGGIGRLKRGTTNDRGARDQYRMRWFGVRWRLMLINFILLQVFNKRAFGVYDLWLGSMLLGEGNTTVMSHESWHFTTQHCCLQGKDHLIPRKLSSRDAAVFWRPQEKHGFFILWSKSILLGKKNTADLVSWTAMTFY